MDAGFYNGCQKARKDFGKYVVSTVVDKLDLAVPSSSEYSAYEKLHRRWMFRSMPGDMDLFATYGKQFRGSKPPFMMVRRTYSLLLYTTPTKPIPIPVNKSLSTSRPIKPKKRSELETPRMDDEWSRPGFETSGDQNAKSKALVSVIRVTALETSDVTKSSRSTTMSWEWIPRDEWRKLYSKQRGQLNNSQTAIPDIVPFADVSESTNRQENGTVECHSQSRKELSHSITLNEGRLRSPKRASVWTTTRRIVRKYCATFVESYFCCF